MAPAHVIASIQPRVPAEYPYSSSSMSEIRFGTLTSANPKTPMPTAIR